MSDVPEGNKGAETLHSVQLLVPWRMAWCVGGADMSASSDYAYAVRRLAAAGLSRSRSDEESAVDSRRV